VSDSFICEPVADHPSSEEIADYLNGRISPDVRSTLESHLADCRSCRQQVVSARRVLTTFSVRRSMAWAVPAAAAAVLAWVLLVPRPQAGDATDDLPRDRGAASGSDAATTLTVIAPPNDGTVEPARVEFIWHAQAGGPLFRFVLTEGNRELWSATTRDTVLRPPSSVALEPGRAYLWYVDALDAAGRSTTSGTQRFVTLP
jgi:hypothetical protein